MEIAIDTNIMVNAFDKKEIDAISFLMDFLSKPQYTLAVDHEGVILNEYRKNLSKNDFYNKYYVRLTEQVCRLSFNTCKYIERHRKTLLDFGFKGEEDHAFVGVAYNGDKVIITEDSDFGKGTNPKAKEPDKQAILAYMQGEMEIKVSDSIEAKIILGNHEGQ